MVSPSSGEISRARSRMKRSLSARVPSFHSFFTTEAHSTLAGFGEDEADARSVIAGVGAALDRDAPAVGRDDVAHDRDSERGGVRFARPTFEQGVHAGLRDTGAVVLHRDRELALGLVVVDVHDDAPARA